MAANWSADALAASSSLSSIVLTVDARSSVLAALAVLLLASSSVVTRVRTSPPKVFGWLAATYANLSWKEAVLGSNAKPFSRCFITSSITPSSSALFSTSTPVLQAVNEANLNCKQGWKRKERGLRKRTNNKKKGAERNRKDFKEKTFQAQARKAGRDAERLKRSGFVARTGYVWQDAVVVGVSLAVCIGAGTYVNRKMEQRARERHHQEYSMTTTTTSSTTSSTPETK